MVQPHREQTADQRDPTDQHHTVDQENAAAYINFTASYLEKARRLGRGPRYLRIGRTIRYRISDLDEWLQQHVVEPRAVSRRA